MIELQNTIELEMEHRTSCLKGNVNPVEYLRHLQGARSFYHQGRRHRFQVGIFGWVLIFHLLLFMICVLARF